MTALITLAETVRERLESTGAQVWYFYPQSWASLPAVSWRESANREGAQADGREHLAELEYTIDLWSGSPEVNMELAGKVDAALAGIRLRRVGSADLFESATGMHHRSLRYRCVADAAGNIYQ